MSRESSSAVPGTIYPSISFPRRIGSGLPSQFLSCNAKEDPFASKKGEKGGKTKLKRWFMDNNDKAVMTVWFGKKCDV
jgi:hypothetical protein